MARFLKIKRVLNWGEDPIRKHYSCYTCRHTFAHRMLAGYWNGGAGCTIETLSGSRSACARNGKLSTGA